MKLMHSDFAFRVMTLELRVRDLLIPRRKVLKETPIKPGDHVLDYGCGPGGYIEPCAKLVGPSGIITAVDVHPLAIAAVERIIRRSSLANVQTVRSNRATGLADDSIDVALLYDIIHSLRDPDIILREINRVLKPQGILSVSDHHLHYEDIVSGVTVGGYFQLSEKGKKTVSFKPVKN
jgi:ubiquinone/menaquinone biosynthesis C-methylase UbiE